MIALSTIVNMFIIPVASHDQHSQPLAPTLYHPCRYLAMDLYKQFEYDTMCDIQSRVSHLWTWSSRYLDNIRAAEVYGNRFADNMVQVRDALKIATVHSIECNIEFAKTRKRKARSGEVEVYDPPTRRRLEPNVSEKSADISADDSQRVASPFELEKGTPFPLGHTHDTADVVWADWAAGESAAKRPDDAASPFELENSKPFHLGHTSETADAEFMEWAKKESATKRSDDAASQPHPYKRLTTLEDEFPFTDDDVTEDCNQMPECD